MFITRKYDILSNLYFQKCIWFYC